MPGPINSHADLQARVQRLAAAGQLDEANLQALKAATAAPLQPYLQQLLADGLGGAVRPELYRRLFGGAAGAGHPISPAAGGLQALRGLRNEDFVVGVADLSADGIVTREELAAVIGQYQTALVKEQRRLAGVDQRRSRAQWDRISAGIARQEALLQWLSRAQRELTESGLPGYRYLHPAFYDRCARLDPELLPFLIGADAGLSPDGEPILGADRDGLPTRAEMQRYLALLEQRVGEALVAIDELSVALGRAPSEAEQRMAGGLRRTVELARQALASLPE